LGLGAWGNSNGVPPEYNHCLFFKNKQKERGPLAVLQARSCPAHHKSNAVTRQHTPIPLWACAVLPVPVSPNRTLSYSDVLFTFFPLFHLLFTRPHLVQHEHNDGHSTKDDAHLLQLAKIKQEPVSPVKRSDACSFWLLLFFGMFLCLIFIFALLDSQVDDFVDDGFSTIKFTPAAISPVRLDP